MAGTLCALLGSKTLNTYSLFNSYLLKYVFREIRQHALFGNHLVFVGLETIGGGVTPQTSATDCAIAQEIWTKVEAYVLYKTAYLDFLNLYLIILYELIYANIHFPYK